MAKDKPTTYSPARRLTDMTPGKMLKTVRQLQEMSQADLAAASGIGQATISAMEHERVSIGTDRARKLARALHVHPAVLVFPEWQEGPQTSRRLPSSPRMLAAQPNPLPPKRVRDRRRLMSEGIRENLRKDADGKIIPSRQAMEYAQREHADWSDGEKYRLAQVQTTLDAAKSKLPRRRGVLAGTKKTQGRK